MKEESRQSALKMIESSRKELGHFIDGIDLAQYEKAVDMILQAQSNGNRIHVTGIGKPGHVAGYVASLLSSTTGLPSRHE